MTLRLRMVLINQFNHLIEELETAHEYLSLTENAELKKINTDILIAKQRVEEFKTKSIKEFEKRHLKRIKHLNSIKRKNRALEKKKT